MKVKLLNLSDGTREPYLLPNKTYHVLCIEYFKGVKKYRINVDEGFESKLIRLFEASQFETISEFYPSCWVKKDYGDGQYCYDPVTWSNDGFFELYYDSNADAETEFNRVYEQILREEP
jgi:hypothetical protein